METGNKTRYTVATLGKNGVCQTRPFRHGFTGDTSSTGHIILHRMTSSDHDGKQKSWLCSGAHRFMRSVSF